MRILLLIFLAVVLPAAVYLAANGPMEPLVTGEKFLGELGKLAGPPTEPEPVEEPEPEPEPEPPVEPEPGVKEETPEPDQPEPKPAADAAALYAQGRFAEAAAAARDENRRALSALGAAFATAFPPPPEPYVVVVLTSGSEHEGFALDAIGEVRLMQPTGRAIGLPDSMIASKRELTPDQMVARTLPDIEKEAASGDVRRLLRATAAAFRIGRPDAAAPLLGRIVGADAQSVLQAISKDVPAEAKDALFRAYRDAAIARRAPAPVPVTVRGGDEDEEPERANPLQPKGDGPGRHGGSSSSRLVIQSEEAKKLVAQARPLREEGEALYEKIYTAGLDKAKADDIETAIRKYKSALDLYEKAILIEDNNMIYALVTGCSKKLFQLRFWKEQVGAR